MATLLGHYPKKMLLSNIGGPARLQEPVSLEVGVDVRSRRADAELHEVEFELNASLHKDGKVVLAVAVIYAGLFRVASDDSLEKILEVHAPEQLFSFAAPIVSDLLNRAGVSGAKLPQIDFANRRKGAVGAVSRGPKLQQAFTTYLYSAPLRMERNDELQAACLELAREDETGQAWCKANGFLGYTSYNTKSDLVRQPAFAALVSDIDRHAMEFAKTVAFDLHGRRLVLDTIWVNVLGRGGLHPSHFHPHSAVSGTYYIAVPEGAGGICFEDPRSGLMMAAPPRDPQAGPESRPFVSIQPAAGTLLLWESWLRHGVEPHTGSEPRISVSFNYRAEVIRP